MSMQITVDMTKNAMGGTELMAHRVKTILESCEEGVAFLNKYEILVSRIDCELDPNKKYIYWIHDLAQDPQVGNQLKDGGWRRFHKLVFVSNWQKEMFRVFYGIPHSKCTVISNFSPVHELNTEKWNNPEKIKFIYHPTPHRGLNILVPVFKELCKHFDNLELNVYSSFNLYGWPERDEQYKALFEECRNHPNINYHGTVSNEELRKALRESHIFAYPNTWEETFCLCLTEAVLDGVICIHPNLGALPEVSLARTIMYDYNEDQNTHAMIFFSILMEFLKNYVDNEKERNAQNLNSVYSHYEFVKRYTERGILDKWLSLDI